MAIYIRPKWRKYIPFIDVYINVPLIRVQMMSFRESMEHLQYIYLGFRWQIWKCEGNIKLYEMGRELNMMSIEKDDVDVKRCGCWIRKDKKLKFFCDKHSKNNV